MKNILLAFVTLACCLSCSNEFDITEDSKDIPIVYGIINPLDTANYIRIERAFINDDIPAEELAQDPDQLYYSNLGVSIAPCDDIFCNTVGAPIELTRVDGNLEGFEREEGVFAQTPNYLYKVKSSQLLVLPGQTYQLRLQRGEGLDDVVANTTVIDNPKIQSPNSQGKLSFLPNKTVFYSWKFPTNSLLIPGQIFDINIRINYSESISNGPFEPKQLVWNFASNVAFNKDENGAEATRLGQEFLLFLANNLEENSEILRIINNADFVLDSGGPEMTSYINVGLANIGITSTQPLPTYTNLSEGRGIFSSKNQIRINGIGFSEDTKEELRSGEITSALNFQ